MDLRQALLNQGMVLALRRSVPWLVAVGGLTALNLDCLSTAQVDLRYGVAQLSPWWGVAGLGVLAAAVMAWLYRQVTETRRDAGYALQAAREFTTRSLESVAQSVGADTLDPEATSAIDLVNEVRELAAHRRLILDSGFLFVATDGEQVIEANEALVDFLGESPVGMAVTEYLQSYVLPTFIGKAKALHAYLDSNAPEQSRPIRLPMLSADRRAHVDDLTDTGARSARRASPTTWWHHVDPFTCRVYGIGMVHVVE